MGFRGPKPDPAAVKEAKGNPGRRPIGADPVTDDQAGASHGEITTAPNDVVPPVWLKGKALDVWNRIGPRLVKMRLLSPIDAEPFARYCRNFARWEKMQTELDERGETYESESQHGKLRRIDPSFMIADRLERSLMAIEDRFGLSPSERQRVYAARAANPNATDLFGWPIAGGKAKKPDEDAPVRGKSSPVGLLN
jgi:P27 family predicted phage terminase small subunit